MEIIFEKIKMMFSDKSLRNRILFVLGMLVVFRLLSAIPIPGVDTAKLQTFLTNNQFVGVLNIFSGGGLATLSIIMMGVGPYITASIIMQLLTMMSPRLKAMYQEDGEIGRRKFTQLSRVITVPLALIQGFALVMLLQKQGILGQLSVFSLITNLSVIVAGSLFIMWIGELATEFGIGNGVSLIIFAGIVSRIPHNVSQFFFTFNVADIPMYLLLGAISLLIIAGVVMVSEAERPIPVTYARQIRGDGASTGGAQTYLPIRVNQAGVIPIIFALSILLFPQMIGNFLAISTNGTLLAISKSLLWFSNNTWLYSLCYFVFVFLFTYFYTAVTFDPEQVATNLQKNGAFIPGIRPGESTREYISKILGRTTMIGAVFLGVIAVLPLVIKSITGITSFAIGGTSLLIAVSVVLDLIKKTDAQLSMREY
ncbi:MAG: preprotein translocase subunit SecY [Candidatus Moranbacteria bacterium]|nr:preprotein translocase subunit SecY [Candidatus Moranbacteria bacterium]